MLELNPTSYDANALCPAVLRAVYAAWQVGEDLSNVDYIGLNPNYLQELLTRRQSTTDDHVVINTAIAIASTNNGRTDIVKLLTTSFLQGTAPVQNYGYVPMRLMKYLVTSHRNRKRA